jgi:hypothetical protein
MKPCILFVSLASNQSQFFLRIGHHMETSGFKVAHVCFHEGAIKGMQEQGALVFNPFSYPLNDTGSIHFHDFGIDFPGLLLGHEKAAYELKNTNTLVKKFKTHLFAMSKIIETLQQNHPKIVLVQELGGFTSVLAAYFAARKNNITNWFIEPSFFKGRIFFTPNTFIAPQVKRTDSIVNENVKSILEKIVSSQSVVIPQKDQLHYRGAGRKLTDTKNIKRLIQKLTAKYIYREREEFEHITGHVRRHVKMYLNSRKLSAHYQQIPSQAPIIYYPFHVPADFALTIRSPEFLNQYAIIDYIARSAPLGWSVVIKEHPALIGAIDPRVTIDLLNKHDNLILLHPSINNHQVLSNANTIVTVNSKSGAEALLYKKRVLALGDSFYKDSKLVTKVDDLSRLPALLSSHISNIDTDDVLGFFQNVWDSSFAGELYDVTQTNIETFSNSLTRCLEQIN